MWSESICMEIFSYLWIPCLQRTFQRTYHTRESEVKTATILSKHIRIRIRHLTGQRIIPSVTWNTIICIVYYINHQLYRTFYVMVIYGHSCFYLYMELKQDMDAIVNDLTQYDMTRWMYGCDEYATWPNISPMYGFSTWLGFGIGYARDNKCLQTIYMFCDRFFLWLYQWLILHYYSI